MMASNKKHAGKYPFDIDDFNSEVWQSMPVPFLSPVKTSLAQFQNAGITLGIWFRTDSRFAPSQWETTLLCNDVSHWLGASLESALWLVASQGLFYHKGSNHCPGQCSTPLHTMEIPILIRDLCTQIYPWWIQWHGIESMRSVSRHKQDQWWAHICSVSALSVCYPVLLTTDTSGRLWLVTLNIRVRHAGHRNSELELVVCWEFDNLHVNSFLRSRKSSLIW